MCHVPCAMRQVPCAMRHASCGMCMCKMGGFYIMGKDALTLMWHMCAVAGLGNRLLQAPPHRGLLLRA